MRVVIRTDESGVPGGHRVQAHQTSQALRDLGVDVVLCGGPETDLAGADIVHCIGADPGEWFRQARVMGIPVVLSTIYWNRDYMLGLAELDSRSHAFRRNLRLAVSTLRRGPWVTSSTFTAPVVAKQLLFESADLLLPNSQMEADTIRAELGVSTPMAVAPNGVDHTTFVPPEAGSTRSGVLYVGRIEPHKNQLGLIRALSGTGIPLTILGPPHPHHDEYLRACQRAAGPDTQIIAEDLTQSLLVTHYQQAAAHAMPSMFETTGLASLEAALCGAAVVTTERGYVSDYFADLVRYCDPTDPESISAAVHGALREGPHAELRPRILSRFTWGHTAAATLAAYEEVLRGRLRHSAP